MPIGLVITAGMPSTFVDVPATVMVTGAVFVFDHFIFWFAVR